ncbi:MAG: helix-turn-helix domain-containing protein [Enterocloster bolteae]
MSKEEIASKLRTAREKAGYKQEDIANILGVTPQKVSSFETGRTRVDVDTLVTLCKLYNVDANDIMGHSSNQKNSLDRLITVYTAVVKNLSQEEKMRLARIILSDDDEE